jgi:hypothetical protein
MKSIKHATQAPFLQWVYAGMCQLSHKPTDSVFEMKLIYILLNSNSFSHKLHHFAATQLQWQNILLVLWYTCHVKLTAGQYVMRTFVALELFHTLSPLFP